MSIPRPEHPNPQLLRQDWINLNGEWEFEIDNERCGKEKEFSKRSSLNQKITVPFCPESVLSGIHNTGFIYSVWYRKDITIPEQFKDKRTILHFGAVDYFATIYINGEKVFEHKGGYTPFSLDITDYLKPDGNYITVCAEDDPKSPAQPSGKQSDKLDSYGCFYTRTTGIWQTVWLEFVPSVYVTSLNITPNTAAPGVLVRVLLSSAADCTISAKAYFDKRLVGQAQLAPNSMCADLYIPLSEKHLWDVGLGNLYDLEIEVLEGDSKDYIKSYFGLRDVMLKDGAFLINGKKVFGRWVLDQGFYPDGIYTAPSDDALKADIEDSMALGFNGARLHEKIFEPRFLYWADKLGYLVWGEHANWGLDHTNPQNIYSFLPEWLDAVKRDYSHPSIIGWCPFNETWDIDNRRQFDELIGMVYDVTKALDPTRPVIDTSGNFHVRTDMFDIHSYVQNRELLEEIFKDLDKGIVNETQACGRQTYNGTPFFVSEFGGTKWKMSDTDESWGYGDAPKTEEEFLNRYKGLVHALLDSKYVCAFCYTQLYDVEQEENGLMTYDREFKFDAKTIYEINTKKAAIEE